MQKQRPWDVQSALLRRHLLELTQSFIIPLVRPGQKGMVAGSEAPGSLPFPPQEHYMASLMPLQKSITPWKVGVQASPSQRREGPVQASTVSLPGQRTGGPQGGGLTNPWKGWTRDGDHQMYP